MSTYPRRLTHIVTRANWAALLTPTYAEAQTVDDEEARDRLDRALAAPGLLEDLYEALAVALAAQRGPRTSEDEQLDKLSAGLRKRRVKPAAASNEISAALVRIDLEIGVAPEALRAALAGPKGATMLRAGLQQLCTHLATELLK